MVSLSIAVSQFVESPVIVQGFPRWLSGKDSACQCRKCGFHPWVGKFPGEGNGNPVSSPIPLPGEPHEQRSLEGFRPSGRKESDTTEHDSSSCYWTSWLLPIFPPNRHGHLMVMNTEQGRWRGSLSECWVQILILILTSHEMGPWVSPLSHASVSFPCSIAMATAPASLDWWKD